MYFSLDNLPKRKNIWQPGLDESLAAKSAKRRAIVTARYRESSRGGETRPAVKFCDEGIATRPTVLL